MADPAPDNCNLRGRLFSPSAVGSNPGSDWRTPSRLWYKPGPPERRTHCHGGFPMNPVLITGARFRSGEGFACQLAARGDNLILVAR